MKKSIVKKLIVLLCLLALPGLALATATGGGWSQGLANVVAAGLPNGGSGGSISTLIFNIMNWLLTILAAIAIIAFVIAGIMYLVSGGDDARMKTAKSAMIAAILGVLVGLMGLVIIYAVQNILNGGTTF
jgi:hypothetical protein